MRAWIIGNGESLLLTPLHLMDVTFATNRIHLLYDKTTWRPTFYVRVEPPSGGNSQEFFTECKLHVKEKCVFPSEWKETLGFEAEWINTCHHYKYPHDHKKFPKEWHLPFICDTNAVTTAMQVAVLKGATELILVGCDLEGGHFDESDKGKVDYERLITVHETAKRSCPVPIYNATIGGRLDVYERRDVWSLVTQE